MNRLFSPWIIAVIMIGCQGNSHVLVKIPEASGICFSQTSKTLFVANDEGVVYEISKEGKILRKKRLGDYDLEGVACDDKAGKLLFAIEGKDSIMQVSQKKLKVKRVTKIKKEFRQRLILRRDKKNGLEGICLVGDSLYLSNQADPSILIRVLNESKKKVPILDVIDHGHTDIAGLTYHDKHLFMVSDSEDLLLKYDLAKKKIVYSVKLPLFAQEGVAFGDEGYIYFANDEGSVLKYKVEKFGL